MGPFASGRAAVKFLVYAAVGAAFVPSALAVVGVPVIVVGFLVTVWAPDGEAVDERALVFARYAGRRLFGGPRVSARARPSPGDRPAVRLADGRWLAALRAGGAPLAYLPPEELARRFALYRELLESVDGELRLRAGRGGIAASTLRPRGPCPNGPERSAHAGYAELVGILAHRRARRRIEVALVTGRGASDDLARLEIGVGSVARGLEQLGVPAERLRGPELLEAASRHGLRTADGAL